MLCHCQNSKFCYQSFFIKYVSFADVQKSKMFALPGLVLVILHTACFVRKWLTALDY